MRRARWAIPLFLLAGAAHADPGASPSASSGPLTVGRPPPALQVSRVSGSEEVTLPGLHGRVVVLDFWATWCGPCRTIMPALEGLYRARQQRGLAVLGVSSERDEVIRAFLRSVPIAYTIVRDTGGTQRRYGVSAIPMLVVVDRGGKVREVFVGMDGNGLGRLSSLVDQLLAEPVP